ncbi:lysophospholipid acyltransferase family protein [Marinicella sediminis]|uniref:L-ornithine N(alpha)-acyltransferase n=1 Tax=Marinicella sediminis TaxID=1792834 RepID=A0ABV7J701_9GAMM|nr:lysophospholipid acyltransferase family protein [Marinicella sediminis]
MLDIRKSIKTHYPALSGKLDKYTQLFQWLEKWLHTNEINQFISSNQHLTNFLFLDAILKEFEFGYKLANHHRARIPAEGRLLIVANHPIGSLDGLALMRMIYEIRPDVKIIATPLLSTIEPLRELFLPVDNISQNAHHKNNLVNIHNALQQEQAVIIFPAGEVSRVTAKGIKDGRWKAGFIKMAERTNTPVLPVLIESRNSVLFYAASMVYKPLSTLMLIHEMYKQKNNTIELIIGDLIEPANWQSLGIKRKALAQRFRQHVFGLRKNKSRFTTTASIAQPIQSRRLHAEIKQHMPIGKTQDGMSIYLLDYRPDSLLIQEIGRLRELSFRMVREGTGSRVDLDSYDVYYKHLVLWNDKELEVVGAYRLGFCGDIVADRGTSGLYCSTLYRFDQAFTSLAPVTLELGRSFVQPKYWGLRGLEYLWYGIGAVLRMHPEIKYLFGAVSIPGDYPDEVLHQMVSHYASHFPKPPSAPRMTPYHPYNRPLKISKTDQKQAIKQLLRSLKSAGVKLPVLFKQYTDLCEPGGVGFINFAVDPDFNGCVDGLIWLELEHMKAHKRSKYLAPSEPATASQSA